MKVNEYLIEEDLSAEFMPVEDYKKAHEHLTICCHDIFVRYKGGILLATRHGKPEEGKMWPVGGRLFRGISMEESIRQKVREESGLEVTNISFLGVSRLQFTEEPFGHDKGTETLALNFVADGEGELHFDDLLEFGIIVTKENFEETKEQLHPNVSDVLEEIL